MTSAPGSWCECSAEQAVDASGLALLGLRYYAPRVGRFWTVDPMRDGLNWVEYARNRATRLTDPCGGQWWPGLWEWFRNLPAVLRGIFCTLVASIGVVAAYDAIMEVLARRAGQAGEEVREDLAKRFKQAWDMARRGDVEGCEQWCWEHVEGGLARGTCLEGCATGGEYPHERPGEYEPSPVPMPWD